MAHNNTGNIRNPRFGRNRAGGFSTKQLSTTRNFAPPAPPVARTPAPRGLSSLRIIPKDDEESAGDFGRPQSGESSFSRGTTNVAATRPGGTSTVGRPADFSGFQKVALSQPPQIRPDGTRPLVNPDKLFGKANGFINAALGFAPGIGGFVGQKAFDFAEKNLQSRQEETRDVRNAGVLSAPEQTRPGFSIERTGRSTTQVNRPVADNNFAEADQRFREEESSAGGGGDFGRSGGDNSSSGRSSSDFGGGDFGFNRGGLNQQGTKKFAHGGLNSVAGGGLVEGPGDGDDDGVLAQPAAGGEGPDVFYSDGEYVLPSDVVSALGDGDTESGAAVLDQVVRMLRLQAAERLANAPGPVGSGERQIQQQPTTPPLSPSSQVPTSLGALRSA